ncbi:immunoglobulin domain-containing protein [Horticoccus luteus]|uniref:Immunoglobulin domain-containing protein n=1 Tax=Horticoccus luteus TaxID=2862869 RepID=A0A8F9XJS6_9BACT|nr:immunoglobulin domain-containing protein [Horticoccus luteus]QYM78983.1 immunoglobulin domain-containing protein [Horticoccus luteus]
MTPASPLSSGGVFRRFLLACLLPAVASAASLVNQNFNDGSRANVYSSGTASTVGVINNALVQATQTSGRGILGTFTPTTLVNTGDTLTFTQQFTLNGAFGSGVTTSSSNEIRIGLFNHHTAAAITDDNWNSVDASAYRGYAFIGTVTGTDAGGKGQWSVRSRTGAGEPKLIGTTGPFTSIGSSFTATGSWVSGTAYTVSITLTKSAGGIDITVTVAGGAFGAGATFTRTDSSAPETTFDTLVVYTSSNVSDSFTVDDLKVDSTANTALSAPAIATQPTNQAVNVGGSVTFAVAASGEPLTYQWHRNGADLAGATNATYVVANAQTTDAAAYSVTVTNSLGTVDSTAGSLIVLPLPAGTSVTSEDFTTNTGRSGWYTSSSTSTISVTNGTLLQTTGTSGRGLLSYFPAQALGLGETLTTTFGFELHGSPGANFTTSAQWRFGLFSSDAATKVDGDNFASTSYHTGAVYDFSTQPGYAAFLGQTSWTIETRNVASPQILSLNAAYTPVGDVETPAFTFDVNTNYVVTLSVQRTGAGADITLTVAGGAFGAGTTFTRSDASAGAVANFDFLAVHCLSNFSDSFSIDDVQILRSTLAAPVVTTAPTSQTVGVGANVTLSVVANGGAPLTYQWQKDSVALAGATNATLALTNLQTTDSGDYTVTVTNAAGSTTSAAATLTVTTGPIAPTVDTPPASQTVGVGQSVTLNVTASGTAPFAYQWYKDGTLIDGATQAALVIPAVSAADAGVYTVAVTNAGGTVTSTAATLAVASAYLSNVSVRAAMTEGQTLIVGFVVSGGAKPVLIRAAGPALNAFGLTGVADPRAILFNSQGTQVGENDNWDASLASTFSDLGAFPFTTDSKDAALLPTIDGPHTAQVSGTGNGIILVEAYDDAAGSHDGRKLANLSARYHVGTSNDILIAGFVVGGTGTKQVLIRAVGPKLADFSVPGVLADPQLTVYDGETVVASNDNWDSSLASTFAALGAFALNSNSKDAALLVTLDAGKSYTVQVSGVGATTGEALVEIYDATP